MFMLRSHGSELATSSEIEHLSSDQSNNSGHSPNDTLEHDFPLMESSDMDESIVRVRSAERPSCSTSINEVLITSVPGAFAISGQRTNGEIPGYESSSGSRTLGEEQVLSTDLNLQESETRAESPEMTTVQAELYEGMTTEATALRVENNQNCVNKKSPRGAIAVVTILIATTLSIAIASILNRKASTVSSPSTAVRGWYKVGKTMFGSTNQDNVRFGMSVAISSEGNRVAVGFPGLDGDESLFEVGAASLLDLNGTDWVKVGQISGQSEGAQAGSSVKLSHDGKRLAIGFPGWSNGDGYVAVYEETQRGNWILLGKIMVGVRGESGHFGSALAFSADGDYLAIGSKFANGGSSGGHRLQNTGAVNVYRFTGGEWKAAGNTIYGENTGDLLGWSVAMSSNGMRIAATALGDESFSGKVRVFDLIGEDWQSIGNDIDGTTARENLGASVALSTNGNILAVGATGYSIDGTIPAVGRVQIFQWKNASWVLVGSILGGKAFERLGSSVALSSDGNRCAIGAPGTDSLGNRNSGFVRVLERKFGEGWFPVGSDIWDGETIGGHFGGSVALSSLGNTVIVGAPLATFDALRSEVGRVLVYRDEQVPPSL